MKRRIFAFVLCLLLILPMGVFFAEAKSKTPTDAVKVVEDLVAEMDKVIEVNCYEDAVEYDKEAIASICKAIDIDEINRFYSGNGMKAIDADELALMFIDGIDSVNQALKEGKYEILAGGTIVEKEDDCYYLQGGSTYDQTFWWGRRRYKSTAAANKWAYQLQNCAAANAATAALAGVVFGAVGALPNGLTSAYCWALGNRVSYVNSLSNRGIVADIYWILVYKVKKQ